MTDTDEIKKRALKVISPILPASNSTKAEKDFLFQAQKTTASQNLPPYYMIYFLLVELLGFRDLGRFEKISWSIPIDYNGEAFLIEHRKFGVGIFARDASAQSKEADEIAALIRKGVKCAKPFFEKMAQEAAQKSELNVVNNARELFERFNFLLDEYRKLNNEAENRKDEVIKTQLSENSWMTERPYYQIKRKADWLAISVVEAFFSWTEHVFIHIGILNGNICTGVDVSNLASAEWSDKFKVALPLSDKSNKSFYDDLLLIRKQIRNFIAHGAFGKEGEAFHFHSRTGAVPIVMEDKKRKQNFSISDELAFNNNAAIALIEKFITHLWSDRRKPAYLYIQEYSLPLILTMVTDGQYKSAMQSTEKMKELVEHLSGQQERAWNMDW